MAEVALLLALVAGHGDLLRVHDDHEIADVAMRGVLGFALAAERVGQLGGQAAERLAGGVDHEPIALAFGRCCDVGLHGKDSAPWWHKASWRAHRKKLSGASLFRAGARWLPPKGWLYCRASS